MNEWKIQVSGHEQRIKKKQNKYNDITEGMRKRWSNGCLGWIKCVYQTDLPQWNTHTKNQTHPNANMYS